MDIEDSLFSKFKQILIRNGRPSYIYSDTGPALSDYIRHDENAYITRAPFWLHDSEPCVLEMHSDEFNGFIVENTHTMHPSIIFAPLNGEGLLNYLELAKILSGTEDPHQMLIDWMQSPIHLHHHARDILSYVPDSIKEHLYFRYQQQSRSIIIYNNQYSYYTQEIDDDDDELFDDELFDPFNQQRHTNKSVSLKDPIYRIVELNNLINQKVNY